MAKTICDPATTYQLASAVAALDAASDGMELGSPSWEMIKDVQERAEQLLVHDVNNTWPEDDGSRAHVDGTRSEALKFLTSTIPE